MWLLSVNAQAAAPCVFNELSVRYHSERLSSIACLIPMTLRGRNYPLFTKSQPKIYFFCIPGHSMLPLLLSPKASRGPLASPGSLPCNTMGPVPPWWVAVRRFPGIRSACVALFIDPGCELSFGDFFLMPLCFQSGPSLRARTLPALFTPGIPVTRTALVSH